MPCGQLLIFFLYPSVLYIENMNTSENQITVDDLVRQAQAGNRQAFSGIVRVLMNKITALTYKMTGDKDTALDLAQDTFVTAWENISSFKFEAKFESWLYRIAYNKTLNSIKKDDKIVRSYDFESQTSSSNPEQELYREELRRKVLSFMETLPKEQRAVFELRFYKGTPFQEIANITGKALGTVKTLYRESVKKLRETVQKQRWQE